MNTLFEQQGGTYSHRGDYYYPDISIPDDEYEIGIWGQRRLEYLKKYHRVKYCNLLTSCTLLPHLAHIDEEAQNMEDRLTRQYAARENVTEKLKATDPFAWVRAMNSIQNCVREVIYHDLIEA